MAMGALPRGDTMFAKAFREAWRKEDQGSATRLREMVEVLRARDIVHGITPEKLRLILEDLGPTFVKLGQIMSMRPDFLPQEYCDELMKLQTEANPLPFSVIEKVIEQEYQRRWTRIFRSIDEEALGSASIAQVHRAVLLDGRKAKAVEPYDGKVVELGVRPEDVHELGAPAEGKRLSEPFDAKVDVYELLGSVVMLHCDSDGSSISASVSPETTARTGSKVQLAFDLDKVHLFDKDSEQAIAH